MKICKYNDCDRKHYALGYCFMHRARFLKHGDASIVKTSRSMLGNFADKHNRWAGENASYSTKHKWLTKQYGKPTHCEACGVKGKRIEWANLTGIYTRNREDYKPMCPSCHRKMDFYKTHCPQGHELSGHNLKLSKKGYRSCRACAVSSTRIWRARQNMAVFDA